MNLLGFDIGGTKCAVICADYSESGIKILERREVATNNALSGEAMLSALADIAQEILPFNPDRIGISCGGPLDSDTGTVINPPNLPGWRNVAVTEILKARFGAPAFLQNDANASAVAEWKFGAGRGCKNLVFLTFGTGLGAGLILDGRLYSGANGNAGEVGHIRLAGRGPIGFGKAGSFEGFCSGGGIARLGIMLAEEAERSGIEPLYCKGRSYDSISAKDVAEAALTGDETALRVFDICARKLGEGLAIIADLLNPEKIIIGSIFARCHSLLWEKARLVMEKEALAPSLSVLKVVPGELGENIGDYAALAAAVTEL